MGNKCSKCRTTSGQIEEDERRQDIAVLATSISLIVVGLILEHVYEAPILSLVFLVLAALPTGYFIARSAFSSLFEGQLDINFLMLVAAFAAFLIGYSIEGAAVLFLFYLAESLEDFAGRRARKSMKDLLELSPDTAKIKVDSEVKEIHVHEVNVGDTVAVKPGERIPLDGTILKGSTSVNQAPVTGESMPVTKEEGDEVFAGTLNEEGYIEFEVTKPSDETTISKIVEIVEEAQKKKSKREKLVERFAKYYTPALLTFALMVALIPPFLMAGDFFEWIYRALILMAVSCPCAFILSTPASMVSGITSASRRGVLIKGGIHLEEIADSRVVVFDKTRTITEGKPKVVDILPFYKQKDTFDDRSGGKEGKNLLGEAQRSILKIAYSVEKMSTHPIADAITREGERHGVCSIDVDDLESKPGKGLVASHSGTKYFVGSRDLFDEKGVAYPAEEVKKIEKSGRMVVIVGTQEGAIGAIMLRDSVREGVKETISEIKEQGIKAVMLTGDNEMVARSIADDVGIDEFRANLLPDQKAEIVEELVDEYEHVVMIGDGINDAPALSEASVGISLGAAGSDIAIDTADIVFMEDEVSKLSYVVSLGKKTVSNIAQNITVSISVKFVLAILAMVGYMTLSAAVGIGDMGLSLVVILNALRLSSI